MQNCAISAEKLGKMLESFLAEAPASVALENGEVLFDFSNARYSVTGEGKCVLHMWSEERNAVRRPCAPSGRGTSRSSSGFFSANFPATGSKLSVTAPTSNIPVARSIRVACCGRDNQRSRYSA